MHNKNSRTKKAAELEAEAKALRRAEAEFFREADERKSELLERWGMLPSSNRDSGPRFAVEGGSTGVQGV